MIDKVTKEENRVNKKRPQIVFTKNTPYMVVDVDKIMDKKGNMHYAFPVTPLCRCGKTNKQPYCDGAHEKEGLNEVKIEDRAADKLKDYIGEDITLHFNLGVCCHDGYCIEELPQVFDVDKRPWIQPDKGKLKDIIAVAESCPSGALSYTIGSRRYKDLDNEPIIVVDPKGPFEVKGYIEIKDEENTRPECKEHYTLCSCGKSKNKPFCDGGHIPKKK